MKLHTDLTDAFQMPADTTAGIFGPDHHGRYVVAWGLGADEAFQAESVATLVATLAKKSWAIVGPTAESGVEFATSLAAAERYAAERYAATVAAAHEQMA